MLQQELAAIQAAGADILFRVAPEDHAKWAEIARHIVMHYNDGWPLGTGVHAAEAHTMCRWCGSRWRWGGLSFFPCQPSRVAVPLTPSS